ncbi:MAG: alpha/beta fold hydrolase [Candidatus Odyssella sp.]|nr:alpha/beta fold hydrolase [Candidatus Odyssella sp.]
MMTRRTALAAAAAAMSSPALAAPPARIAYGAHASQWGELFLPRGAGKVPVIAIVHGGFWRERYTAELGVPLARDIAANHPVAAWNIEYRRVGGGGGFPATLEDVAAALDALAGSAQRAADGRLDLTRVVAVGHSAGGHLAGWLASRHRLPSGAPGAAPRVRLKGAVPQAGVLDVADGAEQRLGDGAIDAFLGARAASVPERIAVASPIALLPAGVPVICVHGDADDTVPIRQSERYVAAARAAGDPARLVRLPGTGHFEVIDPADPAWRACKEAALEIVGQD